MEPETLNQWANIAAVFLLCNAVVVNIAMAVALGFGWWYLRKGRVWLGMPLLMAQVYALRAQHITTQVADKIVSVPIAIRSTTARATTTTRLIAYSAVSSVRGEKAAPQLTTTTGPIQLNTTPAAQMPPGPTAGQ